ncbi:P-loop containing nucleoside triphosphate hydrolase protein [Mycotypha africana]|uniref:P-loop containing nucleoside triphosphate hydrolase protein n=1 Tax=Mycotypha africana TaxID=64632 RepID=UPI0023009A2D|nr:P-loop containing nucleoside triphosphate hydrolase protein [Mycotypha africana]KAI8968849.1 P-loop containing nucleoside triphosphate hydrolase protein [Mycotypha africana]
MSKPRVITIGISGPSCSGKTTLALALQTLLPQTRVIHQDDFFKPDDQIPVDEVTGLANWDSPQALDFDKLNQDIMQARLDPVGYFTKKAQAEKPKTMQNNHDGSDTLSSDDLEQLSTRASLTEWNHSTLFIIVEGFLLFCDPNVSSNLDIKFFTMASKEVLKKRRESRQGYVTLQGYWVDPPDYFDQVVWPQFIQWQHHLLTEQEKKAYGVSMSVRPSDSLLDKNDLYRFNTDIESIKDIVAHSLDIIKQWMGVEPI